MQLNSTTGNWTKNEQSPQSRVTEGLQRCVLRLSTVGCTADVGNWRASTLQQNSPATQVGQLALQQLDLRFTHGQLELYAIGRELFIHHQSARLGDAQPDQGQFAESAVATQRLTADQLNLCCVLQALVGTSAIGPGQTAGAQLNAAIPANHQYHHLVTVLGLDRSQYRPAGGAAGFAIIVAAILVGEFPGPAIVRGVEVAVLFDEGLGFSGAGDGRGEGDEAALANLFVVFAKAGKGKGHGNGLK